MKFKDLTTHREHTENAHAFYVSFADLLLLLVVFFVLVVGMSDIKTGSFENLRTGFSGVTKGSLIELKQDLQHASTGKAGIEISMESEGVRLNLDTAALFDVGSSAMKSQALKKFEDIFLKIRATGYRVDIEGHTDDLPLLQNFEGEIETNWSLAGRRAGAVLFELSRLGFNESRMRIVGYAATKPKVPVQGLSGINLDRARAQNRRVSILIY